LIRIVYTRRAEDELRAIWRYIAVDNGNEPAADRILVAISEKIELLRDHPRIGPRRPDIAEGARLLIEGHFWCFTKHTLTLTKGQSRPWKLSASWMAVAI
jgi:plasmid stabilization system protein ParE